MPGTCIDCKHYSSRKCPAFPDEIPAWFLTGGLDHNTVFPGQTGKTIWEGKGDRPASDFATEFTDHLEFILLSPFDFAGKAPKAPKASGKAKKCTPGKSHFCQKPGGAGTCLPMSKKCGYKPEDEQAIAASDYVAESAPKGKKPSKPKPDANAEPKSEPDWEQLRANYDPSKTEVKYLSKAQGGGYSEVGNQFHTWADEVPTTSSPNPELKKQFEDGNLNYTPAIVRDAGKGKYEPIGDGSDEMIASAAAAGKRVKMIVVPNDPIHEEVARALQVPDKNPPYFADPKKQGFYEGKGMNLSDEGNFMGFYKDEIRPPKSKEKGHDASDEQVAAAAELLLKNNTRNWVPVLVKGNKQDGYEVVGNHFAYDVMQKAGVDRIWVEIVPGGEKTTTRTATPAKKKSTKKK